MLLVTAMVAKARTKLYSVKDACNVCTALQIVYSPSAENWAEEENKCVKINTS